MKWRENVIVKALAFTAAVAAFTATAIMGWYQLMNWEAIWGSSGSYYGMGSGWGYTLDFLLSQDYTSVRELVGLKERQAAGWELSLSEKLELDYWETEFDPGSTNLRWQLLDQEGGVIYGNTREGFSEANATFQRYTYPRADGQVLVNAGWNYWSSSMYQGSMNVSEYTALFDDRWRSQLPGLVQIAQKQGNGSAELDYADRSAAPEAGEDWEYGQDEDAAASGAGRFRLEDGADQELGLDTILGDANRYTNILTVDTPDGTYVFAPTVRACMEANQFGYRFDPYSMEWVRTGSGSQEQVSLVLWIDGDLRADDQYRHAVRQIEVWSINRTQYLAATIVLGVLGVLLMAYLCCGAGRKKGVEGVYLNWFHRLPGDVALFTLFLFGVGSTALGVELIADAYGDAPMFVQLICLGCTVASVAALGMGALITICARCKARTILRDTWTWKLCAWLWKLFLICLGKAVGLCEACAGMVQAIPLIWRAAAGCMGYILFSIPMLSNSGAGLWLIVTIAAAFCLCRWAYQWKKIRQGTQEIIGGNPNYQIDTRHMFPDLKGHADELNSLGHAISTAVDERLKSEHFKAELITNVSHDLKTPLTSIINYVDLLKKEDIDNPKAQEYIEVLDRKSQRLKKLTEDLVEASKASTGNLTVNWERIDWAQLTDQALAETGERLEAQKLTVIRSLPEEPLWVEADGRHLWRVLDNLLTNCAKYALPGTRVYVDLRRSGDWAVLSVKNISRDPLDIPAQQLMERFVRGDESRNLEGSGLGLSIAQSLTELQRGRFEISIDGDLFKAIVTLPLAGEKPSPLLNMENRPDDPIQLVL